MAGQEQSEEVCRQQEELRYQTECHLESIANLATLLQAWSTPPPQCPPVYPDGGEAVVEPFGTPQQPGSVVEACGDLRLPEEEEQPGEGLLQSAAVDELLLLDVDEVREGPCLLVVEEPLHEGLLQPGEVEVPMPGELA